MTQKHDQQDVSFWEVALILVTVLWGWSFVAIHDALAYLSDATFNTYRFLVAALMIFFVWLIKRIQFTQYDLIGGSVAGLALYLAFLFQTKGLVYTTPSNASFITGLAVIFTPFFAFLCLKVNPEKQHIVGALTATVGLALLTLKGYSIYYGDFLVLLCAASFAIHIVILSKVSKLTNVINVTFVQVFVVGFLSLLQSLIFNEFTFPVEIKTIQAILIIAILGTALGFYIQTKAQIKSSPNRIALIIVLEPVFGGLFGYFLAGDRLTIMNWLGACLIVVGMLVTELRQVNR